MFKMGLGTMLVVFALGAVASASASAAECPGTGTGTQLCSGGKALEGTFAFTGKQQFGTTKIFNIVGVMSLDCSGLTNKGSLVATKSTVEVTKDIIEWSNCKLEGQPLCKVAPLVFGTTTGLAGLLTLSGEVGEVTFSAAKGSPFGLVSVTGCEHEFEGKITGTQKCTWPSGTVEAVKHKEVCTASGSKLRTNGFETTIFVNEELELTSGKAFSLQRSS
jgi:hypothetical protein